MKGIYDAILQRRQAEYLEKLLPERDGTLRAIEDHARENRVPIVDPEVGFFLSQLVRISGARRILEVGTATGYSGLWMAKALPEGGRLVTIDIDPARIEIARGNFRAVGVLDKAQFLLGPGLEMIPKAEGPFDLVFLDAIKEEYRGYVERALPKLRAGGILVCDNLLWSGQVADRIVKEDERASTLALREFNPWFVGHPQLRAQILPLGDGTGLAVKVH